MTRAAIYARVSSEAQDGGDSASLHQQIIEARTHCESKGYRVVGEYSEIGVGTSRRRPQFERMLDAARRGRFDAIVCWRSDRLCRGIHPAAALMEAVEPRGIGIEAVVDCVDLGALALMASVARLEVETLRERLQEGKRVAARQGRIPNGQVPYGYRVGPDGRPVVHEEEVVVVRRVFYMYLEGLSVKAISGLVDMDGPIVHRMLRRSAYRGRGYYGVERTLITDEGRVTIPTDPETWIDIPFPAIVDADVWEQVQARKDGARRGPPGSAGTEFMLAKTVHCRCGSMMYTRTTRGRTPEGERIYRYYKCRGGESGERCRERVNVNAEALESAVWRKTRRILMDPETVLAGMEAVSGDEDVGELDARVRDAERGLREVQLEEERLLRLYVSGKITEEQLERQRRYVTERLEHTEAVLSGLGERRDAALDLGSLRAGFVEWAKRVRGGLDSLSVQQRREVVRLVFSRIVLGADNDLTLTCAVVPGDVKGGSHGEDGR